MVMLKYAEGQSIYLTRVRFVRAFKKTFKKEHVIASFSLNFNSFLYSSLVFNYPFLNPFEPVKRCFEMGNNKKPGNKKAHQKNSRYCLNFWKLWTKKVSTWCETIFETTVTCPSSLYPLHISTFNFSLHLQSGT